MNLYGYAGGDPINFADPFGLKDCRKVDCPSPRELIQNPEVQRRAEEMYAETLADGKERGAVLTNGPDGTVVVGPTLVGTARDANGKATVPQLGFLPDDAIGSIHTHPLSRPGKNDSTDPSGNDVTHAKVNNVMPVIRAKGGLFILNTDGSAAFVIPRSP